MRKCASPVTSVIEVCFCGPEIMTVAPARMAPLLSVTATSIRPVETWAAEGKGNTARIVAHSVSVEARRNPMEGL